MIERARASASRGDPDNVTLERRQSRAPRRGGLDSPECAGSNGAIAMSRDIVRAPPRFGWPTVREQATRAATRRPSAGGARGRAGARRFVGGDLGRRHSHRRVRFLRRAKPGVRIVAAEPLPGRPVQGRARSRTVSCRDFYPHSRRPFVVSNRERWRRRSSSEREGVLAGPSSGAILAVASARAKRSEADRALARGAEVPLDRPVLPTDGRWRTSSDGERWCERAARGI